MSDGELTMATEKPPPRFQVGDRVKIRYSDWKGRIAGFRGPLGVGGAFVYCVRVPNRPKPRYIEVPEDELIAIPMRPKQKPNSSESQAPEMPGQSGDGTTLPEVTKPSLPLFRIGDRVEIRQTSWRGRIIDLRFRRTAGGGYVYRVRVPAEPRSIYVELPENYLVPVTKPAKGKPIPSARQCAREEQKKE